MKLGYNFQPIDVDLPDHPRVQEIDKRHRRAALGLLVASYCYVKKHTRDGRVPRSFAENDDPKVVGELVRVGLWVARVDGGWTAHNWETKASGRKKPSEPPGASTTRVHKHRENKKTAENCNGETDSETVETDTVTSALSSHSLSTSSSSDFSQADQINLTGGSRPPWADAAFESAEMSTGEKFDRGTVWFTYANAREAAGRTPSASDFKRYLGSWASRLKSDRVNRPPPRADTRQPLRNPEDADWLKASGGDL